VLSVGIAAAFAVEQRAHLSDDSLSAACVRALLVVLLSGGRVARGLTRASFRGAKGESVPRVSFLSRVGRSSYLAGRNHSGRRREQQVVPRKGRMMRELAALEGVVELALPSSAPLGPAGATRTVWKGGPATVEIVAPDRFCAHVFLNLMGSLFPFELVGTGTFWVIRLQPHGSAWEARLLLLVQRWLETCPLPCATIGYGGRRYVFRSALTRTGIASEGERKGFRRTQVALVTKP
jgi:hypothetical protein